HTLRRASASQARAITSVGFGGTVFLVTVRVTVGFALLPFRMIGGMGPDPPPRPYSGSADTTNSALNSSSRFESSWRDPLIQIPLERFADLRSAFSLHGASIASARSRSMTL